MAEVLSYRANLGLIDSRSVASTISFTVDAADGQAWLDAADTAARNASKVGLLMAAFAAVSDCTIWSQSVEQIVEDDTRSIPADDDTFTFDKFIVGYQSGLRNYVITVPGRVETLNTNPDDPTSVIIAGAGASSEVTDLVAQIEDTLVPLNGGTPTVKYMRIQQ